MKYSLWFCHFFPPASLNLNFCTLVIFLTGILPVLKISRLKTILSCWLWWNKVFSDSWISSRLCCLSICLVYSLSHKESTDKNSLTIFILSWKKYWPFDFHLLCNLTASSWTRLIWNFDGDKVWRFQRVLFGLGEQLSKLHRRNQICFWRRQVITQAACFSKKRHAIN